jgi:hypothetical protein
MLEAVCGLARDGNLDATGMPTDPFDIVNLARLSDLCVAGIPARVQRLLAELLSAIGQLLGYDPHFRRYRTPSCRRSATRLFDVA